MHALANLYEGLAREFASDPVLQLLRDDVSGIAAKVQADAVPDPVGIIGMQSDLTFTRQRAALSWANKVLQTSPTANTTSVIMPNGASASVAHPMTSMFDSVRTMLTDTSFVDGIITPKVSAENFLKEIDLAFTNSKASPAIKAAYMDAAAAFFDNYNPADPGTCVILARQEFFQNVRINALKDAVAALTAFQGKLNAVLGKLPGKEIYSNIVSDGCSIEVVLEGYKADKDGNVNQREAHQNATILTLAQRMIELARSLSRISNGLALKSGSVLDRNYIIASLTWGSADPGYRIPTGTSLGNERPSLMQHFARAGDAVMVRNLARKGAKVDDYQEPIANWATWLHAWVEPLQQRLNYVIYSQRTAPMQGEGPLLSACLRINNCNNTELKLGLLDTIISLIELGADTRARDFSGNSPYAQLCAFASAEQLKLPAQPSNQELYDGLLSLQVKLTTPAQSLAR